MSISLKLSLFLIYLATVTTEIYVMQTRLKYRAM